jgi:GDP-4-dehydro-6-deoxy-D-mannose reductase
MKALIIGAAGFVGSYLAEAIQRNLKCDVIATKMPNEKLQIPGAEICNLNIMDLDSIYALLQDEHPGYIFHLAAQSSVAYSWRNPGLTVDVNIKGALNVLDAIRLLDYLPRVLIVGSGEEYGYIQPKDIPIQETQFLRPGNIYAATKACQNMMATIYAEAYNMQLVMTRSFNHMGPKQAPIFVVSDFCSQVVKIENGLQIPVIHAGNLNARRDFTDVRDVVNAYTRLIQFGNAGETYNVGTGHALMISEILDKIVSQSSEKIRVEVDPLKLRPVDVPIIEPDISKTYNATGWKPEISLDRTISDMLAYWREHIDVLK